MPMGYEPDLGGGDDESKAEDDPFEAEMKKAMQESLKQSKQSQPQKPKGPDPALVESIRIQLEAFFTAD